MSGSLYSASLKITIRSGYPFNRVILSEQKMESRERTLVILGPKGAGKATTTGCILFKVNMAEVQQSSTILIVTQYGSIDMRTMEMFQREGIRTYDQAANRLKRDGIAPVFEIPKYHVSILGKCFDQV